MHIWVWFSSLFVCKNRNYSQSHSKCSERHFLATFWPILSCCLSAAASKPHQPHGNAKNHTNVDVGRNFFLGITGKSFNFYLFVHFSCTGRSQESILQHFASKLLGCKKKGNLVFQLRWTVSLLLWEKGIFWRAETSEYVSYSRCVEIFRICRNSCHLQESIYLKAFSIMFVPFSSSI